MTSLHTIGDQARAYALQSASHRLKSTMDVLTQELTSGKVADLAQRTQGNMSPIHHFEHRIRMADEYDLAASEAGFQADAIQNVLGALQGSVQSVGNDLRLSIPAPTSEMLQARAKAARTALDGAVMSLNTSVGGSYLFAGVDTDQRPLASGDDIMAHLTTLTAGLTTAADVQTAVDAWFAAPAGGGGYLDLVYGGSQGQTRDIRLSEHDVAVFDIDAGSMALRNALKGFALGALAGQGALSGSSSEQYALLGRAGAALHDNVPDIVGLGARTGVVQHQVAQAQTANSAQRAAYETARNDITLADPFATAAALAEVQTQVEMLHTLTARLSNLHLVDFLR